MRKPPSGGFFVIGVWFALWRISEPKCNPGKRAMAVLRWANEFAPYKRDVRDWQNRQLRPVG